MKHVPKARRSLLLSGFTHQIEKSKTGAAACKRCGAKIVKETMRMGYPVKDQRGWNQCQVLKSHSMCLLFLSFAFCRKWKSFPIYLSFLSSKSLVLSTFLKRIKSWRTNNIIIYQLFESLGHAGKSFHCFGQANMVPSLIGSTQNALSWMSFWFLMPSPGMNSWKRWCWGGMPWRWMSHLARHCHCLHLFACYAFKVIEIYWDAYSGYINHTWYTQVLAIIRSHSLALLPFAALRTSRLRES